MQIASTRNKDKISRKLSSETILKQGIVEGIQSKSVLKDADVTLICVTANSNKYYQIKKDYMYHRLFICYGKIGTSGNPSTKVFGGNISLEKEYNKIVAEKKAKGYEDPMENGSWLEQQKGRAKSVKKSKTLDPVAKDKFDAFLNLLSDK